VVDPQIWLGPPQEGKARSTVRIAESTQAIRLARGETGRPPNFEQSVQQCLIIWAYEDGACVLDDI
jgi:hypothetical protein